VTAALLAALALTAATPAEPLPAPPRGLAGDKPVRVEADEVRFNWNTRKVTVVGKPFVTLTHDDATLSCRKLTGDNDAQGRLARATCEGEVKLTRGQRTVTCERATYDRDGATVVCTGSPLLRDGGTEARGQKLTYDLAADEVRLEGAAHVTVPGDQLDVGTLRGATKPEVAKP
jgi:lipopolysaccharide export system protein LptA